MVRIGSARINEKNGINGGIAGDQTGAEVSTQGWYLHPKGWIVIRAKDSAAREKIAHNMESICKNDNIGYCQGHRSSLTELAKPHGYDASKITVPCEVDCSEAIRNCVLYAGIQVGSFSTASEKSALKATGKFDILEEDKYCKGTEYLLRGDILVTKTKGHTVAVLDDGEKAKQNIQPEASEAKIESARNFDKAVAGTYQVTASALHIRAGAGISKKSLGTLPRGTKVRCYGYYTAADGTKWLLVQVGGKTGYCSEKYLKN